MTNAWSAAWRWAGNRRKAFAALGAVALTWAGAVVASPSGPVTAPEWLALAVGLGGVVGVHAVTNGGPGGG